jgi:outer membrane lipoprotein carrier protein
MKRLRNNPPSTANRSEAGGTFKNQETEIEMRIYPQGSSAHILRPASRLFYLSLFSSIFLFSSAAALSADLETVLAGLQKRYATAVTVTGSFRQTYRAPGIDQVESGVFRMKKPCLMRWEYRQPEEKLFIADGRDAYLYVPSDRQVTVQPFSSADMRDTPLELLLGQADIEKNYVASWEKVLKPEVEKTLLIRLKPRRIDADFDSLVLEIDQNTYELRRILMREADGNTSEFLLTNVVANAKVNNSDFRFKPPKGVEQIRLDDK